ncbi:hypothetical protein M378DRAFT_567569 [Amanita muscaria Koide BX008]|uniref:Uncharacterized protein n=1 Tax=Amanita muscaria (strain Koide BX008) TaxID=946122 RepID=A0A0C2SNS0_AMAMK|nr:hypothetical protein M378DRAFT_567569 [Amanita muscaria Koide BX008]
MSFRWIGGRSMRTLFPSSEAYVWGCPDKACSVPYSDVMCNARNTESMTTCIMLLAATLHYQGSVAALRLVFGECWPLILQSTTLQDPKHRNHLDVECSRIGSWFCPHKLTAFSSSHCTGGHPCRSMPRCTYIAEHRGRGGEYSHHDRRSTEC